MTTATAARPETARQRAITTLKFARDMFNKGLADFPADKITYQCSPHDNHLAWTLGHLASTYVWLTGLVGGTPHTLPAGYDKLFGMESKPQPDAKAYPPLAELIKHNEVSFGAFVKAVEMLPESQLTAPCAQDSSGFARDRLDAVDKATWHEGWHTGQVSTLRRALGLKSLFGS